MTSTTTGDQILIQDSIGRVRTPRWRQEVLLEEYERSGMSGAAFAEHVGIKYQTFATWAQNKRKRSSCDQKAPGESHPVQWVEAMVPARPDAEVRALGLQIRLGGGSVMEIADRNGAMLAAEILRHLGEARAC
jgi:hypothetical protein